MRRAENKALFSSSLPQSALRSISRGCDSSDRVARQSMRGLCRSRGKAWLGAHGCQGDEDSIVGEIMYVGMRAGG